MRSSGRLVWVVVMLLIVTMGERVTLAAGPPPLPSCYLRAFLLVEQDVLTTTQRDIVRQEIARIWSPYGLAIAWRTVVGTHVPGTVSIMIREKFANGATAKTPGGIAVAWTMFTADGPLPLIRASMAAARAVAASGRLGGREFPSLPEVTQQQYVALVIGRSIAHEIGHYLLGRQHAEFGLMRAVIPPDDYFGARLNFALTRPEVAALQHSAIWQSCKTETVTLNPAD